MIARWELKPGHPPDGSGFWRSTPRLWLRPECSTGNPAATGNGVRTNALSLRNVLRNPRATPVTAGSGCKAAARRLTDCPMGAARAVLEQTCGARLQRLNPIGPGLPATWFCRDRPYPGCRWRSTASKRQQHRRQAFTPGALHVKMRKRKHPRPRVEGGYAFDSRDGRADHIPQRG